MEVPHDWLKKLPRRYQTVVTRVLHPARLGSLRRTRPLSDNWGYDRGTPVDRYYIEHFLGEHRQDISGSVLEVKDSTYTQWFGSGVAESHVLDIDPDNPDATLIADLATADTIPANRYDCFILTQTLHYVYDVQNAVRHIYRILKPDGVLLATLISVARVDNKSPDGDYWRFTAASARALFGATFGLQNVEVHTYGNVLAAIAFLTGMAAEELSGRELAIRDKYYPVTVAVRAVKRP